MDAPGASVVHVGASHEARRWPVERFAAVAAALAREGHRVVVTGSADERARVARVVGAARLAPEQAMGAGHLDLLALARTIAHARLVVSGDTGVAHLATAFGTPSVVLFGPVPPALWGPPRSPLHRALWAGRTGAPNGRRIARGLRELSVDQVLRSVTELEHALAAAHVRPDGLVRRSPPAAGEAGPGDR
jgi:ADP-heptose:LPS heptosyltransferase